MTRATGQKLWSLRAHPPMITGRRGWCLSLAFLAALSGCRPSPEATPAPAPEAAAAHPPAAEKGVVLAVGTSLTAGYGLPDPDLAYPGLLEKRVEEAGLPYRVVNAGVSGETSAGALRRLDWLLRQKIDVLLLETGANDALRGQDPDATRANIDAILTRAAATGAGSGVGSGEARRQAARAATAATRARQRHQRRRPVIIGGCARGDHNF